MTCDSVLERLLDAEPSEFAADGMTPLGQHLRECARCQRVAGQLSDDTRLLSFAMRRAPVRPPARSWLPVPLAPAFVLGTIVLAVVLRAPPAGTPVVEQARADDRVVSMTTQTSVALPIAATTTPVRAPRVRLVAGRAFPRPVPVTPVKHERVVSPVPAEAVAAAQGVTVDPPPGTRAAVLHTSNPKLIVVWLY